MKIIISNIVTLNGGDFAILEAMIKVLKRTYGEDTEFIVYDLDAAAAARYYPGINFKTLLYNKYPERRFKRFHRLGRVFNLLSSRKRLMYAARLYSNGNRQMADLLLNEEEKGDFYTYASADIIISTGGTYLVENYSLNARIYDYEFTLALKKPLVFFTQSLGPFTRPGNKKIMKKIFDRSNLTLLRDTASYNNLKDIDVNVSKARVCADVVFSDASISVLEQAKYRTLNSPLKVGISVRSWKFFEGRSRETGTEKYYRSVAAICEHITRGLNGEIVFISTCQGINEYHTDDSRTATEIYSLLSDDAKQKVSVNTDFHSPAELKDIIENFDIVISTRMHGAIQALNVGVPVLPIAYEFKTTELFSKLIDRDLILDINTMEEDQSVKIFDQFVNSLPEFRVKLFEKVIEEHLSALKPVEYLKEELGFK